MSGRDSHKDARAAPVLALDEVLERFGGDLDLVIEVATVFLEDYPSTLERIRTAVEAQDAAALHRAAHALKGSVANFGAHEARDAALELETIGREDDMSDSAAGLLRLESALERLSTALHALSRDRG